jgi:hypothetical protein
MFLKSLHGILFECPPFSLPAVIRSHGWVQMLPFRSNETYNWLAYTAQLDSGRVIDLEVAPAEGGVLVRTSAELDQAEHQQAAELVITASSF